MKKNISLILVATSILVMITGCAKLNSALLKPTTQPQVVTTPPSIVTNFVAVPQPPQITVVTQAVAGQIVFVTNTVIQPPIILTNTVLVPGNTVTQDVVTGYSVNPSVISAIDKAKALNSALNPTPSEPLVDIGLGALAGLASLWAGYKTRQLSKAQPKVDALQSVIKAVETFSASQPATPDNTIQDQLKAHIANTASLDQTSAALTAEVKSVTS